MVEQPVRETEGRGQEAGRGRKWSSNMGAVARQNLLAAYLS